MSKSQLPPRPSTPPTTGTDRPGPISIPPKEGEAAPLLSFLEEDLKKAAFFLGSNRREVGPRRTAFFCSSPREAIVARARVYGPGALAYEPYLREGKFSVEGTAFGEAVVAFLETVPRDTELSVAYLLGTIEMIGLRVPQTPTVQGVYWESTGVRAHGNQDIAILEAVCSEASVPVSKQLDGSAAVTGTNFVDLVGFLMSSDYEGFNKNALSAMVGSLPTRADSAGYEICHAEGKAPEKTRASDSGFDLHLVHEIKKSGPVTFYGTGVKVSPPTGYYFDLVARSSLQKKGFALANSVGIIDRSYRGEVIVGLVKLDKRSKDLELPLKAVQLIPRPIVHHDFVERSLSETDRGDGGFGSTDDKTK